MQIHKNKTLSLLRSRYVFYFVLFEVTFIYFGLLNSNFVQAQQVCTNYQVRYGHRTDGSYPGNTRINVFIPLGGRSPGVTLFNANPNCTSSDDCGYCEVAANGQYRAVHAEACNPGWNFGSWLLSGTSAMSTSCGVDLETTCECTAFSSPSPTPKPTPTPLPPLPSPTPTPPPPTPPPPTPPPPTPPFPSPPIRPARPVISNVRAINITNTSATIVWDTDVPADSQVELCTTFLRCGNFTTLNSSLTTSHSVNLSGLTTDTYYYYWVLSKNSAGNLTVVGYVTFITTGGVVPTPVPPLPPPPPPGISPTPTPTPTTPTPVPTPIGDVTPPVISNIQITNITRNSATVSWDTDESADSQIYSCIIIFCFSRLIYDSNLTMSHTFNLPNLRAGRNYQIQISASDASGNTSSSNVVSFKTLPGLVISNIRISNAAQTSLTFAWDTNFPADSGAKTCIIIFFCYFTNLTTDPTLTTTHTITISNLRSGTGYYYQVTSYDPTGFTASSQYLYAKTL